MSWMQQLYETYEQCRLNPEFQAEKNILLPIYHSSQQAHIEVILNDKAEFVDAKIIEKEETVIPTTEQSAGRTGLSESPHALADKIQYCAGDYSDFGGKKPYFDSYIAQLEKWCISSHSHLKVKIIFEYCKKKKLVSALVAKDILHVDGKNLAGDWNAEKSGPPQIFRQLQKKPKNNKYNQGTALVRWRVEVPGDPQTATWEDNGIFDSWRKYCSSQDSPQKVCHVTGETVPEITNHPKRIRNGGDNAKLISVPTDPNFFTYKGRFIEPYEACTVGIETSQKAHNALRWLIARQGFKNDDQVIVSWAVSGKDTPKLTDNSFDFLEDSGDVEVENADVVSRDAGQRFVLRLNNKIAGYQQSLGVTDQIVAMGLDSATPGRLSIVFYRELSGSEFLERLEKWHLDFAWTLIFIKKENSNKSVFWRICAPAPKDIALAAYGKKVDGKLKKATIERLLPCIVDGNPLPRDLLESTIRRVSKRESTENREEWQRFLGTACALFKGYYARHPDSNQRRSYQMTLERERKSRDYLYGRLLAIAEQVERCALDTANKKRMTNAERLMLRFSSHPCATWKTIEESLWPYKNRLRVSDKADSLHCWEQEIEQACSLFNPDEFTEDKPLSGEYLLGYHHQKHYRKPKNDGSTEDRRN